MAYGYTVALLTAEDAAILRGIPERVRATYKAMDANDNAVMDGHQELAQMNCSRRLRNDARAYEGWTSEEA